MSASSGLNASFFKGLRLTSSSGTLLRGLLVLVLGGSAHSSYTGLSSGVKGDSEASGKPIGLANQLPSGSQHGEYSFIKAR